MQENTHEGLYNIAFERSVLSSIIFEPSLFEELGSVLKSDDFYMHSHASIFSVMSALYNSGKPIDEEFIKKDLIVAGAFDESVMLEILICNPISDVRAYVGEIIEKSRVRKLLNITATIRKSALEENASSDTIIARIDADMHSIVDMDASANDFGMIAIDDVEDGETEFILKEWLPIPRGTVTIVAAPGGTGKSWTAMQMAIRHAHASRHSCAVWLSEDPLFESKSRAKAICKDILRTTESLGNIRLVSRSPIQLINNKQFSFSNFYKFKKNFAHDDLIILDPLLAFYGGEENDNSQARMFMQPFMNWAKETNKCIVFLHHSRKGNDGTLKSNARGAGAFVDASRTVYEINKIDDSEASNEREIVLTKDNYGVIKHLKSFKVRREITPKPMIVVHETVYTDGDSFVSFNSNNFNDRIEVTII